MFLVDFVILNCTNPLNGANEQSLGGLIRYSAFVFPATAIFSGAEMMRRSTGPFSKKMYIFDAGGFLHN
jgi:hypothetical protein